MLRRVENADCKIIPKNIAGLQVSFDMHWDSIARLEDQVYAALGCLSAWERLRNFYHDPFSSPKPCLAARCNRVAKAVILEAVRPRELPTPPKAVRGEWTGLRAAFGGAGSRAVRGLVVASVETRNSKRLTDVRDLRQFRGLYSCWNRLSTRSRTWQDRPGFADSVGGAFDA